jgi:hypothetical protein
MGLSQGRRRQAELFDQHGENLLQNYRIWSSLSPLQQQQARELLRALLAEIIYHSSSQPNKENDHARGNHTTTSE